MKTIPRPQGFDDGTGKPRLIARLEKRQLSSIEDSPTISSQLKQQGWDAVKQSRKDPSIIYCIKFKA